MSTTAMQRVRREIRQKVTLVRDADAEARRRELDLGETLPDGDAEGHLRELVALCDALETLLDTPTTEEHSR